MCYMRRRGKALGENRKAWIFAEKYIYIFPRIIYIIVSERIEVVCLKKHLQWNGEAYGTEMFIGKIRV